MNSDIEILLIEDNPNDIEITLRAFNKKKLANKVYVISDGEEALDFIFARGKYADRNIKLKPKVILLDLKLPKIDGLEILKEIKGDSRTKDIPVVVLTSSNEEKDVIESYHTGANSYIVKPVNFDSFLNSAEQIGLYWLLLNRPPVEKN